MSAHLTIDAGEKLTLGAKSYVNTSVHLDLSAPIYIGSCVHIGPGSSLITSTHRLGEPKRRAGEVTASPIRIGDGSWLGARVMVLPGVEIGEGAVVAAGAVVIENLLANSLYAGVPAKLIRRLD